MASEFQNSSGDEIFVKPQIFLVINEPISLRNFWFVYQKRGVIIYFPLHHYCVDVDYPIQNQKFRSYRNVKRQIVTQNLFKVSSVQKFFDEPSFFQNRVSFKQMVQNS
jgi:hypothetical protein